MSKPPLPQPPSALTGKTAGQRPVGRTPTRPSPPVYRPTPIPKCLQPKTTPEQRTADATKGAPAAPPVYRTQPLDRTLRAKGTPVQQSRANGWPRQSVAPPARSPAPKKTALSAKSAQAGKLPNRQPPYRPGRKPVEAKLAGPRPGTKVTCGQSGPNTLQPKAAGSFAPKAGTLPLPSASKWQVIQRELKIAAASRGDEEAALAIAGRKESSSPSLKNNYAVFQAYNGEANIVSPVFTAHSSPGGSHLLHAERTAVKLLCESVGATFYQGDGAATARSLRAKGFKNIAKWYTELPPCPNCVVWLKSFASEYLSDVVVKYCDELEAYYDLNPFQRDKKFKEYVEDVIK